MLGFLVSLIFRFMFNLAMRLWDKAVGNGTPQAGQARVFRIVHRRKFTELANAGRHDFWCRHQEHVDVNVVRKPNVTLYCVDAEYATFVECEQGEDLLAAHSFYFVAQFHKAARVIQLPLQEFHRMAAVVGDPPPGRLLLLYSTGRCGSTMLQQAMGSFPGTQSISEPDSFTNVQMSTQWTPEEKKQLLHSITRMEGKSLSGPDVEARPNLLVLKLRSQCTVQAGVVAEVAPMVQLLFMYRNAEKVAFSFQCAFAEMPPTNLLFNPNVPGFIKNALAGEIGKMILRAGACLFSADYIQALPNIGQMAVMWAVECSHYLHLHEAGVPIAAVRYEDVLQRPELVLRKLAAFLGLPLTPAIIQACVDSLQQDSQTKSSIAKSSVQSLGLKFSAEDKRVVNEVVSKVPALQTVDVVLPGTLC